MNRKDNRGQPITGRCPCNSPPLAHVHEWTLRCRCGTTSALGWPYRVKPDTVYTLPEHGMNGRCPFSGLQVRSIFMVHPLFGAA